MRVGGHPELSARRMVKGKTKKEKEEEN